MVTARQPGPAIKLPAVECAIAAANIRVLRQRNGWSQAYLGELMGWPAPSTVCAAEGHRGGRQRRFARWEIAQLAAIFGVPTLQLLTRCAICGGQPPPGTPVWPASRAPAAPPARNGSLSRRRAGGRPRRRRHRHRDGQRLRHPRRDHAHDPDRPRRAHPGNLAVQPQRRYRQPRRTRTHRRQDRSHGRAQVRAGICAAGTSPAPSNEASSSNSPPRPPPDFPACGPALLRSSQPGADDRTARNKRSSCTASADTSAI